jgi:hypothetical protein
MFSAVVAATVVPLGAVAAFALALAALVATDLLLAWQRSISAVQVPEEPGYRVDGVSA